MVCLLLRISQLGSPFTLGYILTTPKRNYLDRFLINTISPYIGSSLKLCTFIANQKASICSRHFIWKQVTLHEFAVSAGRISGVSIDIFFFNHIL